MTSEGVWVVVGWTASVRTEPSVQCWLQVSGSYLSSTPTRNEGGQWDGSVSHRPGDPCWVPRTHIKVDKENRSSKGFFGPLPTCRRVSILSLHPRQYTQTHSYTLKKSLKVRWENNPCGQAHPFFKWQLDRYFKQFKWTHSLRNCLEDARYWFIRERTLFTQILQGYLENGKWLTAIHLPWKTSQLSPPHLDSVVFCPLKKERERRAKETWSKGAPPP